MEEEENRGEGSNLKSVRFHINVFLFEMQNRRVSFFCVYISLEFKFFKKSFNICDIMIIMNLR